ncbi:MAG: DUF4268 domain-containing protein [Pirellulales bacterium]
MTNPAPKLARLEKVELRDVWLNEAGNFTPWLAQEENIALLSDAIAIDLEVEGQERSVGPFRADILCKDTATDDWVLVENQLERTDHSHLGQLLTYATGLNAVTIVWVAKRFTEEHRAALDWLNEITNSDFNFFGLEIQLWKIGNSAIAPKFNVVCKPNKWTRSISGAAHQLKDGELSDLNKRQLEYWTALVQLVEERDGALQPRKPGPRSWLTFKIGPSEFGLDAFTNKRDQSIGLVLLLRGQNAKAQFRTLEKSRAVFDRDLGPLEWDEAPDKKQSSIKLRLNDCDPDDRHDWPRQHAWLYEKLQAFHNAFSEPIRALNAEDYNPDDDL